MGPNALVWGARDVVRQLIAADMAFREHAEDALRSGSPWYTFGRVTVDLAFVVDVRDDEVWFLVRRDTVERRVADIRVRVRFEPAREPMETRVLRPTMETRAMDFVTLTPASNRFRFATPIGELDARITQDRVKMGTGRLLLRWRLLWLGGLLRAIGSWSQGEGQMRTRRFTVGGDDRKIMDAIASQMHALASEFTQSGRPAVGAGRDAASVPEPSLAAVALGRHHRLVDARAHVFARVGSNGLFEPSLDPREGHTIEFDVDIVPSPAGLAVRLERGLAGVVLEDARREILDMVVRQAEILRERFAAVVGFTPSAPAFARFLGETRSSAVVVALGADRRAIALFGSPAESRSALFVFGLGNGDVDGAPAEVRGPFVCLAGGWESAGAETWNEKISRRSSGDHGRLYGYGEVLVRSLRHWVMS